MKLQLVRLIITCIFQALLLCISYTATADDYIITLRNNTFFPHELVIPVGQKVKITVLNENESAAEFESSDLNREKVIAGKSNITIYVGPLDSGSYEYFDDFHRDTTAVITAK